MARSLEAVHNKVWISCRLFTVLVETKWGVITSAPPMVQRFVGQRVQNLIRWSEKFGDGKWEIIGGTRFEEGKEWEERNG